MYNSNLFLWILHIKREYKCHHVSGMNMNIDYIMNIPISMEVSNLNRVSSRRKIVKAQVVNKKVRKRKARQGQKEKEILYIPAIFWFDYLLTPNTLILSPCLYSSWIILSLNDKILSHIYYTHSISLYIYICDHYAFLFYLGSECIYLITEKVYRVGIGKWRRGKRNRMGRKNVEGRKAWEKVKSEIKPWEEHTHTHTQFT